MSGLSSHPAHSGRADCTQWAGAIELGGGISGSRSLERLSPQSQGGRGQTAVEMWQGETRACSTLGSTTRLDRRTLRLSRALPPGKDSGNPRQDSSSHSRPRPCWVCWAGNTASQTTPCKPDALPRPESPGCHTTLYSGWDNARADSPTPGSHPFCWGVHRFLPLAQPTQRGPQGLPHHPPSPWYVRWQWPHADRTDERMGEG